MNPSDYGPLQVYNSLTRQKEVFTPLVEGQVGMYVCGPTVYKSAHIGNARTFISFDIIFRYLQHLGYRVKYVRNITDVGHLTDDGDSGEDKLLKQAAEEKKLPMEIVQLATIDFHSVMAAMNALPPSIEPTATGHIIEQIRMVSQILERGYAYEVGGSVYFDTQKYIADHPNEYGALSGKRTDDLLEETRDLNNQSDKKHPTDFALWIAAPKEHLMQWESPWGMGYPGWHLECSAMSTKYLGKTFDIHGGGMDLLFPHHENEIAQNVGCCGTNPVRYWLHTNMLTVNGSKMSKSLGNSVSPHELFNGENEVMEKAYNPMVVRFLMLQSHYRSTFDLSNDALLAAEKGYNRLMQGINTLGQLQATGAGKTEYDDRISSGIKSIYTHLNDDFGTPQALASIFDLITMINSLRDGHISLGDVSQDSLQSLQSVLSSVVGDVFGLLDVTAGAEGSGQSLDAVMQLVLELRQQARADRNFSTADLIRDRLTEAGITIKDGKDGSSWSVQS